MCIRLGPVRGFDIAASGRSVEPAERTLKEAVTGIWARIPSQLLRAQRELLARRRTVRHPADLEVLMRRWHAALSRYG